MLANFRGIFADPRAKVCFTSVFFEAIFVHGLFPFVALLLIAVRPAERHRRRPADRLFCVWRRRLFALGTLTWWRASRSLA